MRRWLIPLLRCPATGRPLRLEDATVITDDEITEGSLVTDDRTIRYSITNGVPRFVAADNYAASFGFQWNQFRRSQLDSHSGLPISATRFYSFSGWQPEDLRGKLVLDVGCGAGRFAEVGLHAGARVVALDYSNAVDACVANLGAARELAVVQGDIYHLPFEPGSFDFVYCFGVLQHTPDVRSAFAALPPMLRSGGRLAVDVYSRRWYNVLWPKYWLRPVTRRLPAEALFGIVQRWVPRLLPVSRGVSRVPVVGRRLRYLVPVANYEPDYPLTRDQLEEWAVLDTFDMLSPAHDSPQSLTTLRSWFEAAELRDVWTGSMGFNVGRGRRPAAASHNAASRTMQS